MAYISIPDQLNENQMERYLTAMIEKIIEKIHQKNPELRLTAEDKQGLAKNITKMMLHDQNRSELSREAFEMNPKFLHKLTLAIVMTATLKTHENLFKKLEDLFTSKDIKNEMDFKKLTPEDLKQLKQIQEELRELSKEVLAELKSLDLIRPRPEPSGKKREEEIEQTYDSLTNLLGLVSPLKTGGYGAVVQVFLGNLFGMPNQNPNYEESTAQLSLQDRVDDPAGEAMGLNEAARENFKMLGVNDPTDNLIDQTKSRYQHNEALRLRH